MGQRVHDRRRLRCRPRRKLVVGGALWRFVWHYLVTFRRSPEQIAATLRSMHRDEAQARVRHETICAMIHAQPRGGLKSALTLALRQHRHRRGLGRGIGRKPGAAVPSSRNR